MHGPDHVVHPPGGHALHVALGHHRHQRPLGPPPGLEEPVGEVAALPQLGDGQGHGPGPGVEGPGPVAVAGVHPLVGSLAVGGAADGAGLGRHQRLGEGLDHLSDQVGAAVGLELLAQPGRRVHRVRDYHRIISRFVLLDLLRLMRWSSRAGDGQALRPCPSLARTPRPCTPLPFGWPTASLDPGSSLARAATTKAEGGNRAPAAPPLVDSGSSLLTTHDPLKEAVRRTVQRQMWSGITVAITASCGTDSSRGFRQAQYLGSREPDPVGFLELQGQVNDSSRLLRTRNSRLITIGSLETPAQKHPGKSGATPLG